MSSTIPVKTHSYLVKRDAAGDAHLYGPHPFIGSFMIGETTVPDVRIVFKDPTHKDHKFVIWKANDIRVSTVEEYSTICESQQEFTLKLVSYIDPGYVAFLIKKLSRRFADVEVRRTPSQLSGGD